MYHRLAAHFAGFFVRSNGASRIWWVLVSDIQKHCHLRLHWFNIIPGPFRRRNGVGVDNLLGVVVMHVMQ